MAAAITELRVAVMETLADEFAAENLTITSDKLHDSLGTEGPIAGVSPEAERPHTSGLVGMFFVQVQVFQRWDPQIDPAQKVNPTTIEDWAWRFQRRVNPESAINGPNLSYYVLTDLIYPDDPTGNKSRFVASIVGYGHNPTMTETTA